MAFDIPTILDNPTLRLILIYLPNFAWFFAGFIQFVLRTQNWTNSLSQETRTKGNAYHEDLLIYLGAFGGAISLSVLDILRLDFTGTNMDIGIGLAPYLRLWGFAHASQALVGWSRIRPSQRWNWAEYLGPITYVDTLLALWDIVLAFYL